MREALARRAAEREALLARAREYYLGLRARQGDVRAWVIGSVARGDFHEGSDVDVVVVAPGLPDHPLERLQLLTREAPPRVEPKGWTPEEWEGEIERGNPMVLEVLTVGIPLHLPAPVSPYAGRDGAP
jgi:predicted nucleotidyltransferase